jgi:hypothetical protein
MEVKTSVAGSGEQNLKNFKVAEKAMKMKFVLS